MESQFVPTEVVETGRSVVIHDGADAQLHTETINTVPINRGNTINENWGITDRMNRWVPMDPVVWQTSMTMGTSLMSISVLDIMREHKVINALIRNYYYWTFESVEVMWQQNTIFQFRGSCKGLTNYAELPAGVRNTIYNIPGTLIDASAQEQLILKAVWPYPTPWISRIDHRKGVLFEIYVIVPLTGPNAAGVTLTMQPLVRFNGFKVMFPSPFQPNLPTLKEQGYEENSTTIYYPSSRRFIEPEQGTMMGNVHGELSDPSQIKSDDSIYSILNQYWITQVRSFNTADLNTTVQTGPFTSNIGNNLTPMKFFSMFTLMASGTFDIRLTVVKAATTEAKFLISVIPQDLDLPIPTPGLYDYPCEQWDTKKQRVFEFSIGTYGLRQMWDWNTTIDNLGPPVNYLLGFPTAFMIQQIGSIVSLDPFETSISVIIEVRTTPGNFKIFQQVGIRANVTLEQGLIGQSVPLPDGSFTQMEEISTFSDFTTRAWPLHGKHPFTGQSLTNIPMHPRDQLFNLYPTCMTSVLCSMFRGWKGGFILTLRTDMNNEVFRVRPVATSKSQEGIETINRLYGAATPTLFIPGVGYSVIEVPSFCPVDWYYAAEFQTDYNSSGVQREFGYSVAINSYNVGSTDKPQEINGFCQTTRDFRWYFYQGIPNEIMLILQEAYLNMHQASLGIYNHTLNPRFRMPEFLHTPTPSAPPSRMAFPGTSRKVNPIYSSDEEADYANVMSFNKAQSVGPTIAPRKLNALSQAMNIFSDKRVVALTEQMSKMPTCLEENEDVEEQMYQDGFSDTTSTHSISNSSLNTSFEVLAEDEKEGMPGQKKKKKKKENISVFSLPTKANEVLNKADDILDKMTEALDSLIPKVSTITSNLTSTTTKVDDFIDDPLGMIKNFFVKDNPLTDKIIDFIVEILDLIITDFSCARLVLVAYRLSRIFGYSPSKLIIIIKNIFISSHLPSEQGNEELSEQGLEVSNGLVGCISLLIMLFGAKITGCKDIDEKRCKTTWDFISQRSRDMSNMKAGFTAFTEGLESVKSMVSDLLKKLFNIEIEPTNIQNLKTQFEFLVSEVTFFMHTDKYCLLGTSPAHVKRATIMVNKHAEFVAALASTPNVPPSIHRSYQTMSRYIKDISEAVMENAEISEEKVVPFHIRIYGREGIGKSMITKSTMNFLLKTQQLDPIIYRRETGGKFWDGYAVGTEAILRDDGDMIPDAEHSSEIINLIGPVSMQAERSNVNKKGRPINAKLVWTSGNESHPQITGIASKNAWLRRSHILVKVFAINTRGEEITSFDEPIPYKPGSCDHLRFVFIDVMTKKVVPDTRVMNYSQLLLQLTFRMSEFLVTHMKCDDISEKIDFKPITWDEFNMEHVKLVSAMITKEISEVELRAQLYVHKYPSKEMFDTYTVSDVTIGDDFWGSNIPESFVVADTIATTVLPVTGYVLRPVEQSLNDEEPGTSAIYTPHYGETLNYHQIYVESELNSEDLRVIYVTGNDNKRQAQEETIITMETFLQIVGEDIRKDDDSLNLPVTKDNLKELVLTGIKKYGYFLVDQFLPMPSPGITHLLYCETYNMVENGDRFVSLLKKFGITFTKEMMKSTIRREISLRNIEEQIQYIRRLKQKLRKSLPMNISIIAMYAELMREGITLFVELVATSPYFFATSGLDVIVEIATDFKNWFTKTLDHVKQHWKPILIASVSIYTLYWMYGKIKKKPSIELMQEEGKRIYSKDHEGMDPEVVIEHCHICEKCKRIYSHSHKPLTTSRGHYKLLCLSCRTKKIQIAKSDQVPQVMCDIDEEEAEMILERWEENHLIEENHSYDHSVPRGRKPPTKMRVNTDRTFKQNLRKVTKEETYTEESPSKMKGIVPVIAQPTGSIFPLNHPDPEEQGKEIWTMRELSMADEEGDSDENNYNIRRKAARNLVTISHNNKCMQGFGLYGKTIVTTFHLISKEYLDDKIDMFPFVFTFMGITHEITLTRRDIWISDQFYSKTEQKYKYNDIVFLLMDNVSMNSFADIRHLFCTARDLEKFETKKAGAFLTAIAFTTQKNTTPSQQQYNSMWIENMYTKKVSFCSSIEPISYASGCVWGIKYNMPTRNGWCGSLISLHSDKLPRKLVGMHFCGGPDYGCAVPLVQEMFQWTMDLEVKEINGLNYDGLQEHCVANPPNQIVPKIEGNVHLLGILKPKLVQYVNRTTDLTTSPIFDKIVKHTTEPAPLSKFDPRLDGDIDPIDQGINKFSKILPIPDNEIRNMSIEVLSEFIIKKFYDTDRINQKHLRILTYSEVINGDGGEVEPLNMKTSSGYPYSKLFPGAGKYSCFDKLEDFPDGRAHYVMKKELALQIIKIKDQLFTFGNVVDHFFVDSLKDEKRKIQRVEEGNTRLFNVGNLAWLIIKKQYFWWLYYLMKSLGVDGRTAIGMNMFGPEVTNLVQNLLEKGMKFTDGDIKNWDGSFGIHDWDDCSKLAAKVAQYCVNITKNEIRELTLVGKTCKIRIHIIGGVMYLVVWGMPSGDFLTALFNSLGHLLKDIQIMGIFFRNWDECTNEVLTTTQNNLALPPELIEIINKYVKSTRDLLFLDNTQWFLSDGVSRNWQSLLRDWDEYTYCCKMGDDNVDSTVEWLAPFYTPEVKRKIWKELGYEYTDARKTGVMKYTELENLQFLKCGFQQHPDYPVHWMMTMEKNTINELTNWIRIGQDPNEALLTNLNDALRFLYAHGKVEYQKYRTTFSETLQRERIPGHLLLYEEVDSMWLQDHDLQ